ncbi:MAG: hypothetical protein AAFV29_21365, partial [Myxococcota bacterium]
MSNSDNSHTSSQASASFVDVITFIWSYWRQWPIHFAGMLVGTAFGVLLEVQIPRVSADVVVVTQKTLSGQADASSVWGTAAWLVALFTALFVVKQLYFRNWIYISTQVMQRLLVDGFYRVQRFSLDWHNNHFAGSTQRKITRGMWAYDALADALVLDLGPAIALLISFTVAMALRDPW